MWPSIQFIAILFCLDTQGKVLCSLREDIKIEESKDTIIYNALNTKDLFTEFFRKTDLNPQDEKTLVYSYRVTENNDNTSEALGVLCLVFKLKDELEMIFQNLKSDSSWNIMVLLDSTGCVIGSSDESQIPLKVNLEFNLEREFLISKFGGKLYFCKTCKSNGYQGYKGLGWYGHVMVPLENAFMMKNFSSNGSLNEELIESVTQNEKLFSEVLRKIPLEAEKIQKELDRTIWNGKLKAADNIKSGTSMLSHNALLGEISNTGKNTKKIFETAIRRLHETVISNIFNESSFNSFLAMDIMDRNLYERSNDCRWWKLNAIFREILGKSNIEKSDLEKCTAVLKYINGLYTVYTNIFLFDKNGKIIAVSREEETPHIGKILKEKYIIDTLGDANSQSYYVSPFKKMELYNNRPTYIYASSIVDLNNSQIVVGGIGIIFDSEPQFKSMLIDSMPKSPDGNLVNGCYALFVDGENTIISSTHPKFQTGEKFNIQDNAFIFQAGKSLTQSLNIDGFYNSVGASSSKGYREYKSSGDKYQNNVICYTFTELGKVINKSLRFQVESTLNSDPKYTVSNGPSSSNKAFATFYIGDVLMGCELKDVVECISTENIKSFTNMPNSTKGVLLYREQLVVVVNPTTHFAMVTPTLDLDQIVIIRTDHGFMGLLVHHLGDVPEVSNEYIIKVNEMAHDFNSSIELIVKPTSIENAGAMFFVINPDKFFKSVLSGFCLEELTFMKNQLKAA